MPCLHFGSNAKIMIPCANDQGPFRGLKRLSRLLTQGSCCATSQEARKALEALIASVIRGRLRDLRSPRQVRVRVSSSDRANRAPDPRTARRRASFSGCSGRTRLRVGVSHLKEHRNADCFFGSFLGCSGRYHLGGSRPLHQEALVRCVER